eukprot:UN01652
MIKGAEARGDLIRGKPGIILDATAGNTGIALTLLGTSRGYRTVIVIPETQTAEKRQHSVRQVHILLKVVHSHLKIHVIMYTLHHAFIKR